MPSGENVPGCLRDLNIDGSGILVPRVLIPKLKKGDQVLFTVQHHEHGWLVQTPAEVVRCAPQDSHEMLLGLRFVNSGNLYSQLDDAMGQYFNRREKSRVTPSVFETLDVHIAVGATKILGSIYDLSPDGMGIGMPYVQGLELKPGADLKIRFKLPGSRKAMTGKVQVRQRHVLGGVAYLGILFGPDFHVHATCIAEFIAKRKCKQADLPDSDDEAGPPSYLSAA
jgi:hypothetical protein